MGICLASLDSLNLVTHTPLSIAQVNIIRLVVPIPLEFNNDSSGNLASLQIVHNTVK